MLQHEAGHSTCVGRGNKLEKMRNCGNSGSWLCKGCQKAAQESFNTDRVGLASLWMLVSLDNKVGKLGLQLQRRIRD